MEDEAGNEYVAGELIGAWDYGDKNAMIYREDGVECVKSISWFSLAENLEFQKKIGRGEFVVDEE